MAGASGSNGLKLFPCTGLSDETPQITESPLDKIFDESQSHKTSRARNKDRVVRTDYFWFGLHKLLSIVLHAYKPTDTQLANELLENE